MYAPHIILPFKADEVYAGMAETQGMLQVHKQGLLLEFQTKDAIFGLVKSKVKKLEISLGELADVELRTRFWKSQLLLHINNMKTLNKFPAAQEGVIKLHIKRKDKRKALEIQSYINMRLSEHRLEMLGETTDPFLG